MKKVMNRLSIMILFALGMFGLFPSHMHAQSCKEVFEFCSPVDSIFNKQSFSRSYKISPAQKLKLVQVFYASTGYSINLCKDESLGDFRVRIIQWSTNDVLWDNKDDDFDTSISISFGSTQRIIIEITPQEPEKFNGMSNCLGVMIRYYRVEIPEDIPEELPKKSPKEKVKEKTEEIPQPGTPPGIDF
jgi:hypothetical protein